MDDLILKKFLERCRELGEKIQAIYVFGSRAKGTARPDSDYDVLLVVSEAFSLDDKDALYDTIMDLLLETGRLVSLKVFRKPAFRRLCGLGTPFMNHVLKEGIKIG